VRVFSFALHQIQQAIEPAWGSLLSAELESAGKRISGTLAQQAISH